MRHQSGLTECVVSSNGVLAIKKCSGFGQHATYFYDVIWSTEMSVKLRSFGYYVGLSIKCFVKIKFVFWAVAVVKWSACLPSTLTTWVQVPLTPAGFSVKFVFKKSDNKQKEVGVVGPFKKSTSFSVYAVLFSNVCFSFTSTCVNVASALILPTFFSWVKVSFPLNCFSQLFHVCSWALVSVQRYLYIVKKDWLHHKYPDPTKLKVRTFTFTFI